MQHTLTGFRVTNVSEQTQLESEAKASTKRSSHGVLLVSTHADFSVGPYRLQDS